MMAPSESPAGPGGSNNHFTRAFHREVGSHDTTRTNKPISIPPGSHVHRPRSRTAQQQRSILRSQRYGSSLEVERRRAFNQGASSFLVSAIPTVSDLIVHTQEGHRDASRRSDKTRLNASALDISRATLSARDSVRTEYENLVGSGVYGKMPHHKPDDVIRVMYENYSSLSLFSQGDTRHKKIRQINKLARDYGVDILAGCETRTDWRFVSTEEDKFHNLFLPGQQKLGVAAHNINDEKMKRDQWGGTCITTVGRLTSFVLDSGKDDAGLGRWAWMRLGGGGKHTRVVTAYQPCNPKRRTRGETVWDQHVRYFESRGEIRNPRDMFRADLISLLRRWKSDGDEIILVGDFNENVYTGDLSAALSSEDIRMRELCRHITGSSLPPTHIRGSVAIDAVFATAGVSGESVALLPHRVGVGDHRVFIIDISSPSMIGDIFPRVLPASGRLLNCASDRIKGNYIRVLNQLTSRHALFRKLLFIDVDSDNIPSSQVHLRMNKLDLELEQYMKAAEKDCHKYKRTNIEWSPYAGVWLVRRWLLVRIQRYLSGRIKDPRNLFRDCKRSGVKDPRCISDDELRVEFFVCKQNLEHLSKHGPHYRRQFLKRLVSTANAAGDVGRVSKITGILHREASRKRWKRVNRSTKKPRGGLTIAVKVPKPDGGADEYNTKEGVFTAVSKTLNERFQSALVAQCHRGSFFEDIGHLADGPVAQQILEGTYVYPVDLDPPTRLLFEEATATYATLSPDQVATYVTAEDFQHFWQFAKERTGSSYSGLHFGHYIAASYCPTLAALHAAKLSICARNGVALDRWGRGLTVLLEKIIGNVFVHKLRAICLLEADFNWWNKLVFAKRMMQQAIREGSIPQECFAKKYSHCNHAVLTKQFFCDSSRSLHHPAGLGECDFGDCYDRAAHPPTSIALQSWGIPQTAIRVLLSSMQTMQYVLKTGFGESEESFGGTLTNPNSGLGQGSGASPPAFMALSSLIVNAYRRMGHGAKISSSYTSRLFALAAVMYVDDTDVLHWPVSCCTDPDELVAHVQQATTDWAHLAQASGGILKDAKCSVYFLDYIYKNGRARMKSLDDLPSPSKYILEGGILLPSHISIPQPVGPDAPIVTHDVATASKMLGVHFSPAGNSSTHVEHMVQKGLDWVDCLRTKPLLRSDAWMSFYLQLFPGMSWGMVTVCLHPRQLDTMIQRVYAKALPFLGVNSKIKKEWRTLPEMFQGLGLPNFPLICLAEKTLFLTGNWGFQGLAHSDALAMAYENFLMEVGLYGSPLSWCYESYGCLATKDTWFQNLWLLVHSFKVEIQFQREDLVKGVREGDRSLVSEFFRLGYRGKELAALNIIRRFRNLLHVSDLVQCDGVTLDEFVISDSTEQSVLHTFPREEPSRSDHRLWGSAIASLFNGSSHLPYTLGRYVSSPHLPRTWFTTNQLDFLYRVSEQGSSSAFDVYVLQEDRVSTRRGRRYVWIGKEQGQHPGTQYASVTMRCPQIAVLHSHSPFPELLEPQRTFRLTLESFGNPSLWTNLSVDGDGEWIGESVAGGYLCCAHDGSYMPEESTNLCSAGVVMYCRNTRK